MKIVANASGERAVPNVMCAALIRSAESWQGIQVKPFDTKQLEAVGADLDTECWRRHQPTKTPSEGASPQKIQQK